MCIHAYVCIYIHIYTYTYTHIHIYIYAHKDKYIYIYIYSIKYRFPHDLPRAYESFTRFGILNWAVPACRAIGSEGSSFRTFW